MTEVTERPRPERWRNYRSAAGGLQEYWYPVALSRTIRGKPRHTKVAGHEIVLVRHDGKVQALSDRCPHRQVPLSTGSCIFPGHITCIYHGWTFDLKTGQLSAALTDGPRSPILGQVKVRTYPVEERCGLVWVWTGEGKPIPVEEDIPSEMLRPDAKCFYLIREIDANWRYAVENGFDEAHAKTLHRSSLWTLFKRLPAWHETEIVSSADRKWITRKPLAVHESDDYPGLGRWPTFKPWQLKRKNAAPNTVSVRLPCTLRVAQAGSFGWSEFEWYAPIDKDKYRYFQIAVNWPQSWTSRAAWFIRYWTYIIWFHHYDFNNQDIRMIKQMPDSHPEHFFRPDVSIVSWRQLAEKARDFSGSDQANSDNHAPAHVTLQA
jgi:phenylpropionate dioxygenase-like ring-hydroxylating dioxygenase large terminal subunit